MANTLPYLLTGTLAFTLVYLMVPLLQKWALRIGFVDMPNHRKIHKEPVPLLGGVALFAGFLLVTLLMGMLFTRFTDVDLSGRLPLVNREFLGMILGGAVIFGTGLYDDWMKSRGKEVSAFPKLWMQIVAASILMYFGVRINQISIPFGHDELLHLPVWLSILVTMVWVVGITNMFNFLDGLDGLAAGIASISGTTLFFIALLKGQSTSAMYAVTLIGITLAFLKHNFHPAKIFMGDSGATFLGFILSAIAVEGAFKSAALVSVMVPVLALGVPIFDTVYVLFRRFRENRPIYMADKGHTFHLLMKSGMNQIQTVAFLYLLGICFSLASILVLVITR